MLNPTHAILLIYLYRLYKFIHFAINLSWSHFFTWCLFAYFCTCHVLLSLPLDPCNYWLVFSGTMTKFNSRTLMQPFAAFSMAVLLGLYTQHSINRSWRESDICCRIILDMKSSSAGHNQKPEKWKPSLDWHHGWHVHPKHVLHTWIPKLHV